MLRHRLPGRLPHKDSVRDVYSDAYVDEHCLRWVGLYAVVFLVACVVVGL